MPAKNYHEVEIMAGIKVRRTLDDRGFKKYMAFCESLKDGSNDALIDTFKYKFAVMEGRIVPEKKKRPLTESLAQFEEGVKNLVGAFLPHLDEEEQGVLGNFLSSMQEEIDRRFDRDGDDSDEDEVEAEEEDGEEVCPECGKSGDKCTCDDAADKGDGCPEGECKVDGECVPCKDAPEAKEECGEKPVTECGETEALAEGVGLLDDPDNDFRDDMYPMDDEPSELDFETGAASPSARYSAEAGEPVTDYDAMADELLRDAGYGDLTVENSGVKRENRKFFGK